MTLKEPALAKQYISPIRLFEHAGVPYQGNLNVSRIKKQLTAEFDFTATGFIEVDGYTYNKSDVMAEIEHPEFAERLAFHQQLWQNRPVLTVLEDNSIDLEAFKTGMDLFQNNERFDAFFSPWFAAPFNHINRTFLNRASLQDVGSWLCFEQFILPADREEAFKSLRVFLEENSRIFKNISKENYKVFRPKIEHWIHPGWTAMMNSLPDEFYGFKNDIAVELVNLTVKIQHSNRNDCRAISSGLVQLRDLPAQLTSTIHENDHIYHQGTSASSSSSSGNNYWWLIWVAIMIIRLLARGGCN